MNKRLIINADDFGKTEDITKAIIVAHKYGVLSSTTIMVKGAAFELASKLIKETPSLKTGLHIDLDCIFLMKEPNRFYKKLIKITPSMKTKIKDEIDIQLDRFLKAGFVLTHLDSHHHSHMHPEVLPIVASKAKELNASIRFHNNYYDRSIFFYKNLEKEILSPILKHFNLKYPYFLRDRFDLDLNFETAEVMLHPGFLERWRAIDLARCLNPDLEQSIKERNIEIISFADLK
ncbi:MAG: ChbG/HpnK family deacetylase [Endomicrobium sp.]|jgi:predicted glycoside hydrolase/deacetylase ChbG (UPF0249 family)|nr:ChbG/HpnK family deacetylase [Endomicrobium sp.]